jgi:hypothetical protein
MTAKRTLRVLGSLLLLVAAVSLYVGLTGYMARSSSGLADYCDTQDGPGELESTGGRQVSFPIGVVCTYADDQGHEVEVTIAWWDVTLSLANGVVDLLFGGAILVVAAAPSGKDESDAVQDVNRPGFRS